MQLSLVIPCYREEAALAALAEWVGELPGDEIIFVDDGSDDDTPAALERLANAHPRVRVVTHAVNQGVGAAMRTGLGAAQGDVVVVYDADATYPRDDIARLVAGLGSDIDVVTATPFSAEGGLDDVPFFRRLLSRAAVLAYRLVLGRRARGITVFTCAFRAYRRDVLASLVFDSDGFPAAAEILGRLVLRGARVEEIASTLSVRTEGVSKMRVGRAAWGHLGVLRRLLWSRMTGK